MLTNALDGLAPRLLPPGPGRSLIRLWEVELGTGRPDAILVALSLRGLTARRSSGLRLPSLAHARVLESLYKGRPSSYSAGYVAQLTRSLRDSGWVTSRGHVRSVPRLIARSLIVEAKIADWHRGICQLSKARWASHKAALLMPQDTQHRVSRVVLNHNRLGLLVAHHGTLLWDEAAPNVGLSWVADMWLTELAIRELETGHV